MDWLIVSKQTPNILKKAKKMTKILGAIVDPETGKKTGLPSGEIEDHKGPIMTIGGDGTFLWASAKSKGPLFPVRAEGVGFLCTADYSDILKLGKGFEKKLMSKKVRRLVIEGLPAVNEVVVTRPLKSKIMRAHIEMEGGRFYYKGDGFSISTPHGSTAYNQSLGGPVVSIKGSAVFTPIAPFMRINPMVFRPPITFTIERDNAVAIVDGRDMLEMEKDREYEIRYGKPLEILGLKDLNHFLKYISSI